MDAHRSRSSSSCVVPVATASGISATRATSSPSSTVTSTRQGHASACSIVAAISDSLIGQLRREKVVFPQCTQHVLHFR
ncbi:MAG: hypothetical protein ACK55I_45925, partial [bacterium]